MKGSIDRGGNLRIERRGQTYQSICPQGGKCHYCNVHCPHFDDSNPGQLLLTCGGTAVLIEIESDDRPFIGVDRAKYEAEIENKKPTPPDTVTSHDSCVF